MDECNLFGCLFEVSPESGPVAHCFSYFLRALAKKWLLLLQTCTELSAMAHLATQLALYVWPGPHLRKFVALSLEMAFGRAFMALYAPPCWSCSLFGVVADSVGSESSYAVVVAGGVPRSRRCYVGNAYLHVLYGVL